MKKYLDDNTLENYEKRYFKIIENLLSNNLGSILYQLHNHNLISITTVPDTKNFIEHSAENIVQSLITDHLKWDTCSIPCSADSCYDCGNAIVHIDTKTCLVSEGLNINVEKNQTSYIKGTVLKVGKSENHWEPNLNQYEEHKFNGYIPNLTYLVRFMYADTETFTIEKIILISLPNGQFGEKFNYEKILNAGKSKSGNENKNVRFNPEQIAKISPWRIKTIYERVTEAIE